MLGYSNQTPVLIGHPFVPIGRGEDIRSSFRAFRAAGVDARIYDPSVRTSRPCPELQEEFGNHVTDEPSGGINIWHLNGDEIEKSTSPFAGKLPPAACHVIYPQWELNTYPQEWSEQLNRFDEIWAPSRFVFDCLRKATSKPVFFLPLSVQVNVTSFFGRRYFGLPEGAYLFLFFFDFRSYIDRKNPQAVIKAFEEICAARSAEDVRLVIKIHGATDSARTMSEFEGFVVELRRCKFRDNVILMDAVLTDLEIKSLVRCCDCFVSLHRSEGFGRGLAEAMLLGKPVVATGYSGNLDFMNDGNSCLVRYKLVDVVEGSYPHCKGQVWAEPDIGHAVSSMLRLLDDRAYGRNLGERASRHIRTHYSFRAIGLRYKSRIDEILRAQSSPQIPTMGLGRPHAESKPRTEERYG